MDSARFRWRPGAVKEGWNFLAGRPLLLLILPFMGGIILGDLARLPSWAVSTMALCVSSVFMIALKLRTRTLSLSSLLLMSVVAGMLRLTVAQSVPEDHLSFLPVQEKPVEWEGIVLTEAVAYMPSRSSLDDEGRVTREESSGYFTMDVTHVKGERGGQSVSGRIKVNVYDTVPALLPGDTVWVRGRYKPFRSPTNPGQHDYKALMARRGFTGSCSVSSTAEVVSVQPASPYSPMTWIHSIRSHLKKVTYDTLDPDTAGLISGLVLGYRDGVSDNLNLALQRTGTAHFLAISGLHLVLIYAILAAVFHFLIPRRGIRNGAMIGIILFYTLLTGLQISVVRAAAMILVYLVADLIWRPRDAWSALSASAWIILMVDPFDLFELGFLLSYLAVVGIITIAPVFHDFLSEEGPEQAAATLWDRSLLFARNYLVGGLAISLGAWLLTAPVMSSHFHILTPIIIVSNLILAPLMSLVLILGLMLMLLGTISGVMAVVPGTLISLVSELLEWIAVQLSTVPYSYRYIPDTPVVLTWLFYGSIAAWVIWYRIRPRHYKLAGLIGIICLLSVPVFLKTHPTGLRITMLDVGRGQCMVLEYPDGRTVVYDAGSMSYRDVARSIIAPYLWDRGISRIDTLILSHVDADHMNGAPALIDLFPTRCLVVNHGFKTGDAARGIVKKAEANGIQVHWVEKAGDPVEHCFHDTAVLAPPLRNGTRPTDNDLSIALRTVYSGHSFLMTGDLETPTIRYWTGAGIPIQSEIVQLPHHGKMMDGYDLLADRLQSRLALVSAPRGYYAAAVVQKYLDSGTRVLITGHHGAIIVTIDEQGIQHETFLAE